MSLPYNARFDRATESVQCRYLIEDDEQCPNDVELHHADMRLCRDHAHAFADALFRVTREWFTQPPELHPEPPTPLKPMHDPRRANAVVYYVRLADRIKIGTTINLANRLTAVPHDEVLITEPGTYDVEHQRHRQFKHCHIANEWFDGTDPWLLGHIERMRRAAGIA